MLTLDKLATYAILRNTPVSEAPKIFALKGLRAVDNMQTLEGSQSIESVEASLPVGSTSLRFVGVTGVTVDALKLQGFDVSDLKESSGALAGTLSRPDWEGTSQPLNFGTPVLFGANDLVDDSLKEMLIDEDDLLLEEDRARIVSVGGGEGDDCEYGAESSRKACKNCSCGRADGTVAPTKLEGSAIGGGKMIVDTAQFQSSSCGSCSLGDAFRCAGCPALGLPSFKPGDKVETDQERRVMKVTAANIQVARTNDESIVSKRSACRAGYIRDEYLRYFVKKPHRRSSLINRGYYVRLKAVRSLLTEFIDKCKALQLPKYQILSLGAGFDTTYFALSLQAGNADALKFVEVDFQDTVDRKKFIIDNTDELVVGDNYVLLAGDLSDVSGLEKTLFAAGVDPTIPTFLFTECVMTYMTVQDSEALIRWSAAAFPLGLFLTYEQVRAQPLEDHDAFLGVMKANLKARGAPVHLPQEAARDRFLRCGFSTCTSMTMLQFYEQTLDAEEQQRVEDVEEFDEREEWNEKCCHYFVAVARHEHSVDVALPEPVIPATLVAETENPFTLSSEKCHILRWGWTSVSHGNRVILFGGYGGNKRHQRTSDVVVVDASTLKAHTETSIRGCAPSPRVYHAACALQIGQLSLVYGGRAGPRKPFSDAFLFDAATMTWTSLPEGPEARWRHTLVCVAPGYSVLFGGLLVGGKATDQMWRFKHADRSWTRVVLGEGRRPCARASHAVVMAGNALLISGGVHSNHRRLGDLWRIDFEAGSDFTVAAATLVSDKLPPRFDHSAAMVDGDLWLIGGTNDCVQQKALRVRLEAPQCFTVHGLPRVSPRHALAAVGAKQLLLIGGGMLCFSFGSNFSDTTLRLSFGEEDRAEDDQNVGFAPRGASREITRREIPRVSCLEMTRQKFIKLLDETREPTIFTATNVNQTGGWDAQKLSEQFGDLPASVHVCPDRYLDFLNKSYQFEVIPFKSLIEKTVNSEAQSKGERIYFRSLGENVRKEVSDITTSFPELAAQLELPDFTKDTAAQNRQFSSCLRIASADVQMWTHFDINDNLLYALSGRKRLLLWHPEDIPYMYAEGTASRVLNVDDPDFDQYPLFANATPWEGSLETGDLLYIPALWWHNTLTLEPSIGVNYFFRHLPDEEYQSRDLYGNRPLVKGQRALDALETEINSLAQTLPVTYGNFYALQMIELIKSRFRL